MSQLLEMKYLMAQESVWPGKHEFCGKYLLSKYLVEGSERKKCNNYISRMSHGHNSTYQEHLVRSL